MALIKVRLSHWRLADSVIKPTNLKHERLSLNPTKTLIKALTCPLLQAVPITFFSFSLNWIQVTGLGEVNTALAQDENYL